MSEHCMQCGRELTHDEIAIYKRMVNRGAKEYLCITCFAKKFKVSEELIRESIRNSINAMNRRLPGFKQVKAVEYRQTEFEKTTSKKIKRHLVK